MKSPKHFFKVVKQLSLGLKSILGCFSAFLFFFILFCGQHSSFAANYSKVTTSHSKFIFEVPNHSFWSQISPLHIPFESAPTPLGQIDSDDDLTEDDSNDHENSFLCLLSIGSLFNVSTEGTSFLQLRYFIQNCSTVPLFILHHSWKNFIA